MCFEKRFSTFPLLVSNKKKVEGVGVCFRSAARNRSIGPHSEFTVEIDNRSRLHTRILRRARYFKLYRPRPEMSLDAAFVRLIVDFF